jgi:hypothetical protein
MPGIIVSLRTFSLHRLKIDDRRHCVGHSSANQFSHW